MKLLVAVLVVASASMAFGTLVTVTDIASSDVPTPGMTAFPVPAAAGWTGAKNLVFDNSAAGLGFTTSDWPAVNYVSFPMVNSNIAIHPVSHDYTTDYPGNIAFNDSATYFTNKQGSASDPGADNRYPYNIPRPGRDCSEDFSCVSFGLASATAEFGVFLPRHSNNNIWDGPPDKQDYNYLQANALLDVYVLNPGDTFDTAEHFRITAAGYCPFLMVSDPAGITNVVVIHNAGWLGAPTYGFMDVYSNVPEPMTLALISLGLLAVARRRNA